MNLRLNALIALFVFLHSSYLMAVPERVLIDKLTTDIFPFYHQGTSTLYKGVDDKLVHFKKISLNPKCALVILPGRTEPTNKYAELAYDLKDLNCDLFLWDPRGQGFSERLIPEDHQKGYVEDYRHYMVDFKKFWDQNLKSYKKVGIVAHSMGAAIALASIAEYQLPVKGLVVSSPMMEIITKDLPEAAALWSMKVLKLVGKKKEYTPGGGRLEEPTPFEENRVTSSQARYAMANAAFLNEGGDDMNMGAATNNWLLEGIRITHFLRKKKNQKKLHPYPIILYQAGKDLFSKAKRQRKFCERHPKCELIHLKDAKHEMFQERDELRSPIIANIKSFFQNKL